MSAKHVHKILIALWIAWALYAWIVFNTASADNMLGGSFSDGTVILNTEIGHTIIQPNGDITTMTKTPIGYTITAPNGYQSFYTNPPATNYDSGFGSAPSTGWLEW